MKFNLDKAYHQRREDFNKEVLRWFEEKYQPKVSEMK